MKLRSSLLALTLVLSLAVSPGVTFAGGSSFSWKSTASDVVVRSETDDSFLSLFSINISNYFSDKTTMRVDAVSIICTGAHLVRSLTMNSLAAPSEMTKIPKNYGNAQITTFYPATILPADASVNLNVRLTPKKTVTLGQTAQCAVDRLKITNAKTGELIYVGRGSHGFAFNDANNVATVIIGSDENDAW